MKKSVRTKFFISSTMSKEEIKNPYTTWNENCYLVEYLMYNKIHTYVNFFRIDYFDGFGFTKWQENLRLYEGSIERLY